MVGYPILHAHPAPSSPMQLHNKFVLMVIRVALRNVPYSEKDQAYAEYGIQYHSPGQYEVDHLIPLELGGSNDIANLWPEAASPKPGFHEKDQVENYLHDQVCSGAMSLQDAQTQIATNWLAVYHRMPTQYQ